jgi:transposase
MGLHSPVSSAPGAAIQSNTPSSPHSDAFKEHPSGSVQTNSTVESGNVVGISTGHKLVGSQKRKRRVSVTSASHEKKSRNGSGAESEKSKSDLQQSEEGEGASNAKQYLDKLARKYVSGFEGMTTNDSPQSDGEVSDIFNDGQNNNNEKGTFNSYPSIVSPMFQRKEYVPRPLQKGRMSPKFMGPSIYRQSSTPQPEEEANVPVSTSSPPPPLQLANMEGASPLGNNKMYQDQIRHMLSAKMSVEEIAVQLKLPPSIIVYYVSLMGIPIKTEEEEKALLPYKAKEEEPGAGRRSGKLDKKSLKQLIDSNKSIREIADILGVHPTTVYRAMKAYDLSLPGHNQASTLADKHLNTPRPSYSNMEEFAGPSGEKTMPQPPTGQRVRLKRDRLHLLKNLIMGGATVRECANILGVHHTTIYRAMRNLNMDGTQPHKSLQANTSQSSSTSGHADLPASSLLHHLPFADANNLRRWSDPAAAASGYLGLASSFPNSFPEGFPETLKHTTSPSFEQEDKKEANEEDEDEEFEGTPQNYSQQFRDLQEELGHEEEVEDDDDDEENAKDITSFDA